MSERNIGKPLRFSRAAMEGLQLFGLPRRIESEASIFLEAVAGCIAQEQLQPGKDPASVVRKPTLSLAQQLRSSRTNNTEGRRILLSASE